MSNQTYYPTCRFCGKQTIPYGHYDTQEEADEAALSLCDCARARQLQDDEKRRQDRANNIARLKACIEEFANYCEQRGTNLTTTLQRHLSAAGTLVLDDIIDSVSIKFGRLKASITTNSKNNLVVGFTYADSTKTEVI